MKIEIIDMVIGELEKENIDYKICNVKTGHFNLYNNGKYIMSYWCFSLKYHIPNGNAKGSCSKAQAINKYIDELEESSKLSELWCKSQETVKNLENKLNTQRKYYQNRLMKIQQENKQLKEKIENLTTLVVCGDTKQIKNTAQYKLEQLQQRIDKAIEYIENNTYDDSLDGDGSRLMFEKANGKELLEILKGDNNE